MKLHLKKVKLLVGVPDKKINIYSLPYTLKKY